ncbi:hypothetical protein PL8927_760058 [Planktothrix serta PCC 8927]|uniref:Uncharacterized protein n=1 Tax=Planktothrix serta PCC 8927 TaxID=671068 RepID=A0A7Z9BUG5_9CYAN|nr:hypothetical protein [Planktothrix serta]VXD22748.1 hypothetical protein PL8927_760058 [Planktothrix serta PCC 8927]
MTSFESTNSNSVEANGISLEIVNPNSMLFSTRVYPLPKNELGATTNMEFTVRIINNTLNPIRLNPYQTFIPELLTADGQPLQKQIATVQPVSNTQTNENCSSIQHPHETRKFTQWEVKPELPTTTSLTAKLSWHDNLLQLKIPTVPHFLLNSNNIWCFNLIESASYQFRFILNTNHETTSIVESKRNEVKTAQPIGSEVVATPWINLRLVQPVATDSSAIEIDGLQFKVEMPETVLTIPPRLPSAQTPVKLGIRVTNNTSAVLRFEQIGSLGFNLIDSDGKEIQFTEAQWRRWIDKGLEFYIVQPGESEILVLDATLSWHCSQLQLVIPNKAGGFYYFRGLKQGRYQIQAIYHTSEHRANYLNEKGVENVWSGWIAMPFVKFCIV